MPTITITTTIKDLPEECWEAVLKFLDHHRYFEPLSLVSKQFLSITNRLRSSLLIRSDTLISRLFSRIFNEAPPSSFLLPFVLSLKSLTCIHFKFISIRDEFLFAIAESGLQFRKIELCNCHAYGYGVLKRCRKIRHLSLAHHSRRNLFGKVPGLEVLDLSYSEFDDSSLLTISKSCSGLLELNLGHCCKITTKGVKQAVTNFKQLREISLISCDKVAHDVVAWMVSTKPSLRRILPPPRFGHSLKLKLMEDERFKIVFHNPLPRDYMF
ncbi:hypothetical protein RIF29_18965 [Crotalaria pallida]|uniref:F-box domain-containing protein n=1 Tax=Crotalaria pallida TaxID=3830 RepID=A0AAN9EZ47_CROPI